MKDKKERRIEGKYKRWGRRVKEKKTITRKQSRDGRMKRKPVYSSVYENSSIRMSKSCKLNFL